MSNGRSRDLFPGGNTSLGFFSYYGEIITQEEADRVYILKGGPGVGKSTFLKRVGEEMLLRGYDVEFLHCSSDNNSLDGLTIPKLKTAFIDGTAPHVVDPKSPGAVDQILNFGDFWNEDGIRVHKKEIIETGREISAVFARSYKYLKAASAILEDSAAMNRAALKTGELNIFTQKTIEEVFAGIGLKNETGRQRRMFVSAITPKGYFNYLNNLLSDMKVYEIRCGIADSGELILEKVKAAALERNLYVECYYCAFDPYKLEHLLIPELGTAFTTSSKYHDSTVKKHQSIDIHQFYDQKIYEGNLTDLFQNMSEFDNLMSIALSTIARAKDLHDRLETYYIPNINFKLMHKLINKVVVKLAGKTGQVGP